LTASLAVTPADHLPIIAVRTSVTNNTSALHRYEFADIPRHLASNDYRISAQGLYRPKGSITDLYPPKLDLITDAE